MKTTPGKRRSQQWQQAVDPDADALAALAASEKLREKWGDYQARLAREAVADGCSWQDVADVLGVSRQTAHQRFSRKAADRRNGGPKVSEDQMSLLED